MKEKIEQWERPLVGLDDHFPQHIVDEIRDEVRAAWELFQRIGEPGFHLDVTTGEWWVEN